MADKSDKWKENIKGKMFVDKACIACEACVTLAPHIFNMHPTDGHSYVKKQPTTHEEEAVCKEAIEQCPVEAIGNDGDSIRTL